MIEIKVKKEDVNMAIKAFDIETWYKRLGLIGEKGLGVLARKWFLPNFAGMSLKTCVHYLVGRVHKVAFKRFSPSRKSQILDLIHINVCIMQSKSIGDVLYFMTFIDDCSRKSVGLCFKI